MKRNNLIAGGLFACVVGMVGLSFAAVPLYRMFCAATGYGGTPQIGGPAGPGAATGTITVRFDANTSPSLPWQFAPGRARVTVPLGEEHLAFYTGRNLDTVPVTGVATYNVTPGQGRPLFPQDRLLLLQRADAGSRVRTCSSR